MNKSSFLRRSRRNALVTASGVRVGGSALILVLLLVLVRVFFPGPFVSLVSPLWRAGSGAAASAGTIGTFFTSKADLARERDRLVQENTALTNQTATLRAQVADLTRLVGTRTEPTTGIVAGVLARPPVSPYDVLVVDAGSATGVHLGAQVAAQGGIPIGTVASVTTGSARVLLYSAPGQKTEAWAGEARTAITLTGQGSGAFTAVVPRDASLVAGDSVYVAGPGAVPVGTIIEVGNDPSSPQATVTIRPMVNLFSVTWVTIDRQR